MIQNNFMIYGVTCMACRRTECDVRRLERRRKSKPQLSHERLGRTEQEVFTGGTVPPELCRLFVRHHTMWYCNTWHLPLINVILQTRVGFQFDSTVRNTMFDEYRQKKQRQAAAAAAAALRETRKHASEINKQFCRTHDKRKTHNAFKLWSESNVQQ